MRFMNSYDVERALRIHAERPNLLAAARQVDILRRWANENSDGWAYWPKPARSAARLMEIIEGDGTYGYIAADRPDVSADEVRKALRAVKAFRTRAINRGMPAFEIVEVPA